VHINFYKTRQGITFFTLIIIFTVLIGRLLYIQVARHGFLTDLANKQHKIFIKLEPRRGKIYDRLNRVLAVYLDTISVYAVPREIESKKEIAYLLGDELSIDRHTLYNKLKRNNYFAWVKRKIETPEVERVEKLDIKGVYFIDESKRFYPGEDFACHVIGFTDIDNQGLEGVELYYNDQLKGEYGWRRSIRDAHQREIVSHQMAQLPSRDGNSLVLTIDEVAQHIIEKEMEGIVKKYRPAGVSIVAMNPRTGEILAMANYPSFNPNNIKEGDLAHIKNKAITDAFEPGSVFKVVTASAALDLKSVDFDTEIFCENGAYRVANRTLHDYRPYGTLTFRQVIEKSSNIGVAKVADKVGKDNLSKYIRKFNFDRPLGIDLPGEIGGIMRDPETWSPSDMTTIPMGQGIAVTALQLASCVSVIANDGILMKPYIVKSLINEEGIPVKENGPVAIRRVISEDAALKVKELLAGVVDHGTGRRAQLDNFKACGKTGTAQKVRPQGGYYKDKYIATFIGFAPQENPVVSLAVCVDDPKGEHFGGRVSAPAFKNIMTKLLSYMEIESDRDENKGDI